MITVTFPSGIRVQYSTATTTEWLSDRVQLIREDENRKRWIVAYVLQSSGAIIEHARPCEVTAPPVPSPDVALDELLGRCQRGELKGAASWKLRDLKRALQRFNARSGNWRD